MFSEGIGELRIEDGSEDRIGDTMRLYSSHEENLGRCTLERPRHLTTAVFFGDERVCGVRRVLSSFRALSQWTERFAYVMRQVEVRVSSKSTSFLSIQPSPEGMEKVSSRVDMITSSGSYPPITSFFSSSSLSIERWIVKSGSDWLEGEMEVHRRR